MSEASSRGPNVDETFEAHISPVREALAALLDAADRLLDEWGYMPAADSAAMAELANQAQFQGSSPWGDEPVQEAHNQGNLLLFGSGDCARALVRALSDGASPVYAHQVLARAALELASRAWWLFEPAIPLRLRVARVMNERIVGLYEQRRLPLPEAERARASQRLTELLAEAERLGFETVRNPAGRRLYVEEMRPGQTKLVTELLGGAGDRPLGALVYGAYSAVAHGTTFGLTSRVKAETAVPRAPGVTWGTVYASSQDVVQALTAVILGTKAAHERRKDLFGWVSESWNSTATDAIQAASRSLASQPKKP